jgi:hypothetical protein
MFFISFFKYKFYIKFEEEKIVVRLEKLNKSFHVDCFFFTKINNGTKRRYLI